MSDLEFNLPPPNPAFDAYSKQIVNAKTGRPLGEDPVAVSAQDSIAAAQSLTALTSLERTVNASIRGTRMSPQAQLDNLDPSSPDIPLLQHHMKTVDQLLQSASQPSVQSTFGLNSDNTAVAELQGAHNEAVREQAALKPNFYFTPNAYIAFVINFITLARVLMENKMLESQVELQNLDMMFELGVLAADQITKAGQAAAEMHRIAGVTAAIAAATIVITTVISTAGMMKNKMEPEPETGKSSYKPLDETKPPDTNNYMNPIKDANGNPVMDTPPKYIKYGDEYYRNEGRPMFNKSGLDENHVKYLDRGAQPLFPNDKLKIEGASHDGNKLGNYDPTDPAHLGKPIPTYEKYNVGNGDPDDGKQYIIRNKEDIRKENEIRQQQSQMYSMVGNSLREFVTQTTKSIEEFMKEGLEINKSQAEAFREILSTLSRLIGHSMDKASEAFKANSELIAQLLQQIDSIRSKLQDAINASMKKQG